jgi:hypothetical protein
MKKEQSDAEVLGRYTTFEPPPSGFDPLTAKDHLLLQHGFPRRPDPEKEPQLYALWQKAFSRPMKVIKAELGVDRVSPQRDRLRPTRPFDVNGGWAGAEVNTKGFSPPDPANMVYAQWIQPPIEAPQNPVSSYLDMGFWVGLGGNPLTGSHQVVQAGTRAVWDRGNIRYDAFTEWWDDVHKSPPCPVMNFPIDAGDHVDFLVCTPQPNSAFVAMRNFTSSTATWVQIAAPPDVTNDGFTAEWVVEGHTQLLDFFSVTFGQCTGGTQNRRSFDLTTGTTDLISSKDGNRALANGYLLLSNAVIVVWNDFGP